MSTEQNDTTIPATPIISRMALNDNKAGMDGLDKERINKIIQEASRGSKFYERERQREAEMSKKIDEHKAALAALSPAALREGLVQADRLLDRLDAGRSFDRSIVHVDLDAFFAAVEMRDDPTLRDKPMAVGSDAMLSTSNYAARRFGVRAAMPGFIARKLCPHLVIVPSRYRRYRYISKQFRSILAVYDPHFGSGGIDEAYLDFTDHLVARQCSSTDQRTFYARHSDGCTCWDSDDEEDEADTSGSDDEDEPHTTDNAKSSHTSAAKPPSTEATATPPQPTAANPCDFSSYGDDPDSSTFSTVDATKTAVKAQTNQVCSSEHPFGSTRVYSAENTLSSVHSAPPPPETTTTINAPPPPCPTCGRPRGAPVTFGVDVEEAVREMRFRVEQRTRLTCSAGIANNTLLAKVCSDYGKPNGQYRIAPNRAAVLEFVKDLPVKKICGVGKVTDRLLSGIGVVTCFDLYTRRAELYHLYSSVAFQYFMRITLGLGSTDVSSDSERKSMSIERTFGELSNPAELQDMMKELCRSLSVDLKKERLKGKTVTIKLKTTDFEVRTRAVSLREATCESGAIHAAAADLLRMEIVSAPRRLLKLRLMGVRMSNFSSLSSGQQSIAGAFAKARQLAVDRRPKAAAAGTEVEVVELSDEDEAKGGSSNSNGPKGVAPNEKLDSTNVKVDSPNAEEICLSDNQVDCAVDDDDEEMALTCGIGENKEVAFSYDDDDEQDAIQPGQIPIAEDDSTIIDEAFAVPTQPLSDTDEVIPSSQCPYTNLRPLQLGLTKSVSHTNSELLPEDREKELFSSDEIEMLCSQNSLLDENRAENCTYSASAKPAKRANIGGSTSPATPPTLIRLESTRIGGSTSTHSDAEPELSKIIEEEDIISDKENTPTSRPSLRTTSHPLTRSQTPRVAKPSTAAAAAASRKPLQRRALGDTTRRRVADPKAEAMKNQPKMRTVARKMEKVRAAMNNKRRMRSDSSVEDITNTEREPPPLDTDSAVPKRAKTSRPPSQASSQTLHKAATKPNATRASSKPTTRAKGKALTKRQENAEKIERLRGATASKAPLTTFPTGPVECVVLDSSSEEEALSTKKTAPKKRETPRTNSSVKCSSKSKNFAKSTAKFQSTISNFFSKSANT